MTLEELRRSADVFAIELLDMHEHHRVLFGNDALKGLSVPMHLHRAQVEYELREKLILLRQRLLLAAGDKLKLWELLLSSLPAFATLFRHVLITFGDPKPGSKREDRKSTRLNSSHSQISYAVFCLKKKQPT